MNNACCLLKFVTDLFAVSCFQSVSLVVQPLKASTKYYNYTPGQRAAVYMSPYASRQLTPSVFAPSVASALSSLPQSVQKIAIPTVCAGCVIGRNGAVIRELRLQSCAQISIADPAEEPQERVVTITGTHQSIQTAVYLIRQLVEQFNPIDKQHEHPPQQQEMR